MVCVAGAAGGAAAYDWCFHRPPPGVVAAVALPEPPAPGGKPAVAGEAAEVLPEALLLGVPVRSADGKGAEELRLLEQARVAVAREDFASALVPLAAHARRFRDGRLTEEREALRVKALLGLGRRDEVRQAAAAFVARFPRSLLVPIVNQMASSGS